MRLKLTLRQLKPVEYLPVNTGYYLASVIYATLAKASGAYAAQLHDYGYAADGARQKFKYFTFSNLRIPSRTVEQGRLVSRSRFISLYLSSPKEDFLQNLINGLFADGMLKIKDVSFEKQLIESLPEPAWRERMTFTMLSPLTLSVYRNSAPGKNTKEYLRYDDYRLPDVMRNNLQAKYRGLYGKELPCSEEPFSVTFAEPYLRRMHENGKSIEKLITIKDGEEEETKVKAIECPFTITGNPELIKTGYECGFGENNPMGFGMVQAEV